MIYRSLGKTAIKVSAIGFGCSNVGSLSRGLDNKSWVSLLEEAYSLGVNFYDTANIYGAGQAEEILGDVFRTRRDKVVILTKVGYELRVHARLNSFIRPLARKATKLVTRAVRMFPINRSEGSRQHFDLEAISLALEGSLRRLRTDYVDILLLHSPSEQVLNDEGLFFRLEELKASGKLRYYGVSSIHLTPQFASRLPAGAKVLGTAVNPLEAVNLSLIPTLNERGLGIAAYQALASGNLLYPSSPEERQIAQAIDSIARDHEMSRAQVLINFALNRPGIASVVVGISNSEHLRQNLRVLQSPAVEAVQIPTVQGAH